jgi:hypothetical protein
MNHLALPDVDANVRDGRAKEDEIAGLKICSGN